MNTADMRIGDDVRAELDFEPRIDVDRIVVTVENAAVSISGNVEYYAQRVLAEETVKRVRGVAAVTSQLTILPPSLWDKVSDTELAARAINILRWVTDEGYRLTLSVRDGRILLTGAVDHHYQKVEAERALQTLRGVNAITNSIAVRRRTPPAGAATVIAEAIRRHAELCGATVGVDVAGSTVTLGGQVATWRQRDLAEMRAWALAGISAVDNDITVG